MLPSRVLEVLQILRQAENRHDFGGDRDVEAVLAREAVRDAAERVDDRAQRAVVHVEHALPGDAARVDAKRVAPVDVIVDQRREQVVRARDGVEVAGEVQVDVFHRHDLGVAAARRAAFDAEAGPERRFAQAHDGLLADAVQAVAEADRGRRLAFAGRRRADGRNEDQLAVLVSLDLVNVVEGKLGLGPTVGDERLSRHADFGGHISDRL